MTRDDILTLARAGFTADQIAALATVNQPTSAPAAAPSAPAAQPVAQPAAQPAAQPVAQPAAQPAEQQPANANDGTEAILRKLGVLTDALQSSAILNAQQPKQETADDILAAIIAPPTESKQEE